MTAWTAVWLTDDMVVCCYTGGWESITNFGYRPPATFKPFTHNFYPAWIILEAEHRYRISPIDHWRRARARWERRREQAV